jgi:hypothetical protein
MSGFVGLNTPGVPDGSAAMTQVVLGHQGRALLIDTQGREQAAKVHPNRALRCPPERRVMRARSQPVRDRFDAFAVTAPDPPCRGTVGNGRSGHLAQSRG